MKGSMLPRRGGRSNRVVQTGPMPGPSRIATAQTPCLTQGAELVFPLGIWHLEASAQSGAAPLGTVTMNEDERPSSKLRRAQLAGGKL